MIKNINSYREAERRLCAASVEEGRMRSEMIIFLFKIIVIRICLVDQSNVWRTIHGCLKSQGSHRWEAWNANAWLDIIKLQS
jgi:hypothetical protein